MPYSVAIFDKHAPVIQIALKIDDIVVARINRNIFKKAGNKFWTALKLSTATEKTKNHYADIVRQSEAFGFACKN